MASGFRLWARFVGEVVQVSDRPPYRGYRMVVDPDTGERQQAPSYDLYRFTATGNLYVGGLAFSSIDSQDNTGLEQETDYTPLANYDVIYIAPLPGDDVSRRLVDVIRSLQLGDQIQAVFLIATRVVDQREYLNLTLDQLVVTGRTQRRRSRPVLNDLQSVPAGKK